MSVETLVNQIQQEFAAFKTVNDNALAELKQFGEVSAATNQAVEAANAKITELQNKLQTESSDVQNRLGDIEDRINRGMMGGAGGGTITDEQRVLYANWQSVIKGRPVSPSDVDVEEVRAYRNAFVDWFRHGDLAEASNRQILNAMSVGSDADGGYWVDPDTSGRIATMIYETSPIRQLADIQTISTDALEGDVDLDEAGAAWVGETQARTETSTPQVGRWRIPVAEQYAEPRTTQKLLDDAAINVESWLSGKVANRFVRSENAAFVAGDGVLKPRGFLSYPVGTPSASTWGVIQQLPLGHASTINSEDSPDKLIDLVFSLKSDYRPGAVFGMNRLTEAAIRKLRTSDGTDFNGAYLWQPDFTRLGAATLLGFPIVEMPDMPDIGSNELAIVFGNLRAAYQIVDRMGIRILRDPYTLKGFVKFYTTKRVGGAVVNFEAIKIGKVSAT